MSKVPIYNNQEQQNQKFKQQVYSIKYNPQKINFIDNKLITYGNAITYYTISNQLQEDKSQKQKFPVSVAQLRKDKQLVVSGDDRGVIQISMLSTKSVIRRIYGSRTQISSCIFSNDGLKIYVGNVSGQLYIFNIALGNAIFAIKLSNGIISSILEIQHQYLLVSTTSGDLFIVQIDKQVIQKGVSEEKALNDKINPAILKLNMQQQINNMILLKEEENESNILLQFKQNFKIVKIVKNLDNQEEKFTIIEEYKSYDFSKEITDICKISSENSKKLSHIQYLSQDNFISQNYLQNNHLIISSIDGTIRDEQTRIIYSSQDPILQLGYYQDVLFYLSSQQQLITLSRTTDQLLQKIQQLQNQESLLHGHNFVIVKVPQSLGKQNSTASQYLYKANYLKALEVSLNDTQSTTEAILKELDKLHGYALQNAVLGCQGEILRILLSRVKIMLSNEYQVIALKVLKILVDSKQDMQMIPEYQEIKQILEQYTDFVKYIKLFQ